MLTFLFATGGALAQDAPDVGGDELPEARPPAPPAAAPGTAEPVVVPPELTKFVEAEYPPEAFAKGEGADVLLRLTISDTGAVDEAIVVESGGEAFDTAATNAAMLFEFTPAVIDGQPTPVQIQYRYRFEVKQESTRVEVPVDEARPTGDLGGVALEKGTRAPLVGVVVRLADGTEAITDAQGVFRFEKLPAGPVVVTIDDPTWYALEDDEEVVAGKLTEVKYYLERKSGDGASITVVGRRVQKEVARRTLTMEEIRKIPGTQGDALKVIQNLPGVARIPFGGGALIIRGSNPGDSAAVINRHFVPLVFHFGGLRSVFPSELLEDIDFYPGNFGAEFGRYTGGIVDARIRRPREDRLHGRFEADVFDAGVLLEGPLHEGATFAIAGRRSYIDAILPFVLPDDAPIDFTVAPRYYDYQALYDYKKGDHRLRLYFLGSDDKLEFLLEQPANGDPSIRGTLENETYFNRLYLAWNAAFTDDVDHEFSLAAGQNQLYFAAADQIFFLVDGWIVTLRDDLEVRLSERIKLRTGLDVEAFFGSLNIKAPVPPKEGQQSPPLAEREVLQIKEDFFFLNPSPWVELELKLGDLFLVPGFRADYDKVLDDWAFDPRLSGRYDLVKDEEGKGTTVLKAGAGLYSQRPTPDESDDVFGNPDIGLEHSLHVSAGFEQRLTSAIDLDVVGFYKYLYDSVGPSADPGERVNNGTLGRIYGMEVLLRHNLRERFFGWISYTLMRSERKDDGEDDYRLFTLDQTHILTMLGQYKLTSQWEIGLRWRYVTGNPQTPRQGAVYAVDSDVYVPYFGSSNSERVDAFHQLDLRVDRRWVYEAWILTAYLEIQNVYNRANPEGITYNFDSTQSAPLTGLPIIPSFGLRGEF
ncbi:MAG: TonB family protein [Myxococcales bacterium]|nr:TonB family protein [Myxococcales bacterium]